MTAPEDGWTELERLARAISPKRWRPFIGRASNTFAVMAGFTFENEVISWPGLDGSDTADTPRKREALVRYLAAANPATTLKLIAAARLNRGGADLGSQGSAAMARINREELAGRLEKYLAERAKTRQIDPDLIHGLHIGDEREVVLTVADLKEAAAALRQSPSVEGMAEAGRVTD